MSKQICLENISVPKTRKNKVFFFRFERLYSTIPKHKRTDFFSLDLRDYILHYQESFFEFLPCHSLPNKGRHLEKIDKLPRFPDEWESHSPWKNIPFTLQIS